MADHALAFAALPVAATTLGFALHGPWALAGAAGGAFAALAVREAGGGAAGMAAAASVPPLLALKPEALAVALLLAAAAAWMRWGRAEMLLLPLIGVVLPGMAGVLAPAVGGAAYLSAARWPRAVVGVPVAFLGIARFHSVGGLAGLAVVALALVARWVAGHPANLTMARRMAAMGLIAIPGPAALGYILAALGVLPPGQVFAVSAALAAGLAGGYVLLVQLGLGVVVRASDKHAAPWLTFSWSLGGLLPAWLLNVPVRQGLLHATALAALLAPPFAMGVARLLAARSRRTMASAAVASNDGPSPRVRTRNVNERLMP